MTYTEARKLATRVAKESAGVRVKFGSTNGHACLHLAKIDPPKVSSTIFHEWEWAEHPWNRHNVEVAA